MRMGFTVAKMKYLCLCVLVIVIRGEIQSDQNGNTNANENNGNAWLDGILPPNERTIQDEFFEPSHTYTFLYDAQLATGIPGASKQHSGMRIQCLAELIFSSPTSCSLQLSHIRVGRMNRMVPNPRWIMPFETFEEVPMHDDVRRKLEMPVGFTYQDGVVADVTFDGEEPPWCSNFVRGVLNMLQVTLKSDDELPTEEMRLVNVKASDGLHETKSKQYRVMEKTLEGECESIYTAFNVSTPENSDKLLLIKSIDFDKCRMRPQVKYNFRFADSCPDCRSNTRKGSEEFLKTTTLAEYHVRRNSAGNWILEKAAVESEHIFSPYDPQAGVAVSYINQTLVLIRSIGSTETARHLSHPVKSDWGLTYALDFDIWRERFAMDGEEDRQLHFLRRMPYSDVKQRKRELVSGLVRALLSHMKVDDGLVDEEAPRHMMRLVSAFRLFMKMEIDEISQELTSPDVGPWTNEERKQIKDIFPHVVAMCATKECVAYLVEKIKDQTISPTKAAMAIMCLLNDRSISERQVADLLTLTESEVVSQHFVLRQSLWLTIGSLINGLCAPNEDVLAREYRENVNTFCTRQLKENYVEILFNKFSSAEKWADKILFMKAIGNAGIDLSIFNLEKIIKNVDGQSHSDGIRIEAVLALRQLKHIMPRKVRRLLMPIVSNRMESPQIRVTAAYQLLRTFPERAILDQLARMILGEPSRQVASFIYAYMDTVSKSSNPCEQKMAADLKFSLRHANLKWSNADGYSSMNHYAFHSRIYLSGLDFEFSRLFTNGSFLPKYLTTTLHGHSMGFWYKYLLAFGLVQEGVEPMVREWMLGRHGQGQQSQQSGGRLRRLVANVINGVENEINTLFTKLGIRPRQHADSNQEPKLYAYMKFLDQDYSILPFILTKEQRDGKQADGVIDLRQLIDDLRSGLSINLNEAAMLTEMSNKIPTTLGMPLVWDIKIPVMYSVAGRLQVTSSPQRGPPEKINVVVDLKPSIVATMMTEIEVWSPVANSGLMILSKVKLHTPIDAKLEIDRKSTPTITKVSFKVPTGKKELLSLETRPISLTRVWPTRPLKTWNEPDAVSIMSEDASRISQFKGCFGRNFLGVEICARGQYARAIELKKDAPRCPLIGPEKIIITTELANGQAPVEISLKFTANSEKLNTTMRPSFNEWTDISDNSESGSSEANVRTEYEIRKPIKHTVKVEAEMKGRRLLNADFIHHYDPNRLYGKVDWKFQSPALPRFAVCLKSETLFPQPPYTIDDMKNIESKKVYSANKLVWGSADCTGPNFIAVQMEAHQPKSHKVVHSKDPEHAFFERCLERQANANCSPIMQYQHLVKSSDLTKYHFMIDHKNAPPFLINASLKAYDRLKHALYSHGDFAVGNIPNSNGKVNFDVELNPQNKRIASVAIHSPQDNMLFTDVPVPQFLAPLNLKSSHKAFTDFGSQNRGLCHISKRKIRTFDNVEYTVPISTCFHILAKDCSSNQPRFIVMMRKISDDEKKEVKILIPTHKVLVSPKDDQSIEIDINGKKYKAASDEVQEISADNGPTSIRIFSMGPYVKLEFPQSKLFVYFDGYAAHIKLSRVHLHSQCGLCGHFDNEPSDEFRKPNFELENDIRQFYKSWTTAEPSGCTVPDANSLCKDGRCSVENVDAMESGEKMSTPQKMTRAIEIDTDLCFSVEPIPTCPTNMYAIQKETRQVQFVCMSRDEELAEITLDQLRSQNVIELNKQANGIKNLDIPIKCAPFN